MKLLSLRGRVLLGAVLWTVGLFVIAGALMTFAILHHPDFARATHGILGHTGPLIVVAVICLAIGLLQVRRGLSPLKHLRDRLADVHHGRATRIEGGYPAEVQPLVDDLNALVEERGRRVARAIAKAGDLAHGLKTPLAVLSHEAQQADAAGHREVAAAIAHQVDRMRRQIDYHLAQARSAASAAAPGARADVLSSVSGLVRALQRLHADRGIAIEADVPAAHAFRGQQEDLEEMLGNLLDNACRWARARVKISSVERDGRLAIAVDDDGPGIPVAMRESVLQRGVRADETAQGSGLGLAIVRDLAEIYGGGISLTSSPLGGVRAELDLPST